MKAAVFEQFGHPLQIKNLPVPEPSPSGVVIAVQATGLCRSDWHGWMGHDPDITLPHVPGHELAGVISAVGREVKNWRTGARVTVPFVCACGTCAPCASGNHQVCDNQTQPGFTHWGSFAEYVAIDYADTNLVAVPESIDTVTAAALGCRFVTSFRAVVDQGRVSPGQWLAVHGCGGVGLSAIMIASSLGARVVAVDIGEQALEKAKSVGAEFTLNASRTEDIPEAVRGITGGGAHVSIDALGSTVTCFNSVASLRKRGRHVQVGLMLADQSRPAVPMDRVIAHELEIVGSHGIQAFRYPDIFNLIESGKLAPDKLVGRRITLEESLEELPRMNSFNSTGITVIDRF